MVVVRRLAERGRPPLFTRKEKKFSKTKGSNLLFRVSLETDKPRKELCFLTPQPEIIVHSSSLTVWKQNKCTNFETSDTLKNNRVLFKVCACT